MRNVKLTIDNTTYEGYIAQSYADLRPKQAVEVVMMVYTQPKTYETKLEVCLSLIFGDEFKKAITHPALISELLRVMEFTEWAWTGGFDKQPIQQLSAGFGKRLVLPDEELHYLSTGEFITATAYILAFAQATAETPEKWILLDKFVATICRPHRRLYARLTNSGANKPFHPKDKREVFSSHLLDSQAQQLTSVPLSYKIMVLQWFLGAVGRVQKQYGMVGNDDDAKAPLQVGLFVRDWEQTVHELAHEGNFGRYDDVMTRPIHDVLAWLELRKVRMARATPAEFAAEK